MDITPPTSLDLGAAGVGAVIWCTGYTGDFSWLHPVLRDGGRPVRRGAAGALPGLWYLGLRWLLRRCSGNFLGFPGDAATVADEVARTLHGNGTGTRRPHRPRAAHDVLRTT